MEIMNSTFVEKFKGLLYSLTHTHDELEMVANEVQDTSLRTALYGLSTESYQYVDELCSHLKEMGIIKFPRPTLEDLQGANALEAPQNEHPGNELNYICSRNENFILAAYRNILNEGILLPALRDMLMCQLKALHFTFMKIRLLNSARFEGLVPG